MGWVIYSYLASTNSRSKSRSESWSASRSGSDPNFDPDLDLDQNSGPNAWHFLPVLCYVSADTSYGPVSVSVCHKSVFGRKGWTNPAGFWHRCFLHCVIRKFKYLKKYRYFPWNFASNSGLRKLRHSISIVEARCQLSSIKVDAQSLINWTVVVN